MASLARSEREKGRLRNWDGASPRQELERIVHRPVKGNVRKFRGEVCDRDRRKDRKEHKIPSLKTKEVKERSLSLEGGVREPQEPGAREPAAGSWGVLRLLPT